MLRSDLRDVLNGTISKPTFLLKIKTETEEYRRSLEKLGSSCPIVVEGGAVYRADHSDVLALAGYLDNHSSHVRDYVLTAILLDDLAEKDEETVDLLEELTAPEG
jgi:hypothetical protein